MTAFTSDKEDNSMSIDLIGKFVQQIRGANALSNGLRKRYYQHGGVIPLQPCSPGCTALQPCSLVPIDFTSPIYFVNLQVITSGEKVGAVAFVGRITCVSGRLAIRNRVDHRSSWTIRHSGIVFLGFFALRSRDNTNDTKSQ